MWKIKDNCKEQFSEVIPDICQSRIFFLLKKHGLLVYNEINIIIIIIIIIIIRKPLRFNP